MNTPGFYPISPRSCQHCKRRRRAFTLIELLSVIAIIGILAAIIIPTVGKVRQTAKVAQSVSNVRQMAQGFVNYANDHRQVFPKNNHTVATNQTWVRALEPYIGLRVEYTQSNGVKVNLPPILLSPLVPDGKHKDTGDYGVNNYVILDGSFGAPGLPVSRLVNPSRTVLVMATQRYGSLPEVEGGGFRVHSLTYCYGTPSAANGVPGGHGASRLPAGFGDGHVKTFSESEFFDNRIQLLTLTGQ